MTSQDQGSEFDLIAQHFAPLAAGDAGALGLTDDAAVLDVPAGFQLVVTTDALVAGVHFLESLSPEDIAHKVVGVNLSDLAAMGAKPRAVFLAAQFPRGTSEKWIAAFAKGLGEALGGSGAVLLGGDTVATPGPMAFTLTALGFAQQGRVLTRSGAQVGDDVYVTGTIGDGALGLLSLTGGLAADAHLARRYARPEARYAFSHALADAGLAHACVDISDGLVADLGHICEASHVMASIEAERVPVSDAAKRCIAADASLLARVLSGGDDYELAFTAAPDHSAALAALAAQQGLQVTRIGHIQDGTEKVQVLDRHGRKMDLGAGGYVHL
ncbi:MAG TPA: thiamine-phosphate kinase [Magnetovibrio sp.]